jgi:energy-coupling factor transporter ATP-binding protein EcfA2
MAEFVLIFGKSGSGKSRSLINLNPEEYLLINVTGKRLPFKGKPKYEYKGTDYNKILYCLKKNPTKIAVIDDAGYLMTEQFMSGHSKPKSGSSSFDLYNDIADRFYDLIKFIKALPEDQIVYVMMHEETSDFGDTRLKTIGKLLDQKVCIEGLSSIVLRCVTLEKQHYFLTRTDGMDITKTPEGLFDEEKIENDLKAVDSAIRNYYEIA